MRVIDGNATLLKNCATKPEMYYDVDQAVELNTVFASIAAEPCQSAPREVSLVFRQCRNSGQINRPSRISERVSSRFGCVTQRFHIGFTRFLFLYRRTAGKLKALVTTMATSNMIDRLRNKWRAFRASEGGNTAIIFGLAVLPIFGAAGAAVDYSRANSVKAAMQAALDSTALMLSKEARGLDQAQLEKKANDYFKALFNRAEAYNIVVKPTYTQASSQIVVTGHGNHQNGVDGGDGDSRAGGQCQLHGALGHDEAARCVGARQYRLDE